MAARQHPAPDELLPSLPLTAQKARADESIPEQPAPLQVKFFYIVAVYIRYTSTVNYPIAICTVLVKSSVSISITRGMQEQC